VGNIGEAAGSLKTPGVSRGWGGRLKFSKDPREEAAVVQNDESSRGFY